MDGLTALDPNDKPIAEGYAMMAKLLQDRKENDETLSPIEIKNLENVITWFQGKIINMHKILILLDIILCEYSF